MNVTSAEPLEQPSPLEAESAAGYSQDGIFACEFVRAPLDLK